MVRKHKVARVQDAVLQVYDYYEPSKSSCRNSVMFYLLLWYFLKIIVYTSLLIILKQGMTDNWLSDCFLFQQGKQQKHTTQTFSSTQTPALSVVTSVILVSRGSPSQSNHQCLVPPQKPSTAWSAYALESLLFLLLSNHKSDIKLIHTCLKCWHDWNMFASCKCTCALYCLQCVLH